MSVVPGADWLLSRVQELPYEGVMVDLSESKVSTPAIESALGNEVAFEGSLRRSIDSWRREGKLSAWLTLPLELLHYGRAASKCGFVAHHAPPSGRSVVLYTWLQDGEDKVPAYASTQVGCAGFVVNARGEVLVVKEWRTRCDEAGRKLRIPSSQWKLPGGLSDPGESFLECAARETLEETGVDCTPLGVLALWHRHSVGPFAKSDLYCVVRLEVNGLEEIAIDDKEISQARWYDMQAFLQEQDHPLVCKVIRELYDNGRRITPACELVDLGVQWPNRPRYPTYFPRTSRSIGELKSGITAVATDVRPSVSHTHTATVVSAYQVDGTLLRSDSTLHPANVHAIAELLRISSLRFFVATGKCREGARASLGHPAIPVTGGVFCNGLVVYDDAGNLIADRRLDRNVIKDVIDFALRSRLDVVSYSGDILECLEETDRVLQLATQYREPRPRRVPDIDDANKLLLLGDSAALAAARPDVELLVSGRASVTIALPTMLEILPFGQSKRQGVLSYCLHHGIDEATQLFAVGDGENDAEMLRHAAVGVAMGNAAPLAAREANIKLDLDNDQAGAALAFRIAHGLASAHGERAKASPLS